MSAANNKRDLKNYFSSYEGLPFEKHQEEFRRRALIKKLSEYNFQTASEIGCGRNSLFEFWQPAHLAQTIEPIPEFLNMAESSLEKKKVNWRAFLGRAEDFHNFSNLQLSDITILSSILHEVENPQEFLSSCMKITLPGGYLVVIVTNKHSIHRLLGVHYGFQESTNSKTQTEIEMQQSHGAYSMNELRDEMELAGLEVISMETIFPKLFPHSQMATLIASGVITEDFLKSMEDLAFWLPEIGSEILAVARIR
jgi:ubiquinone/menaquinone biosynthesis C-methylase UbiE